MSLFVERSALVAILLQKEGWKELAGKIEADSRPTTGPICLFEARYALEPQGIGSVSGVK